MDVPARFMPINSFNTNDIFISTFTQVARSYLIDKFHPFHELSWRLGYLLTLILMALVLKYIINAIVYDVSKIILKLFIVK